MLEPIDIGGVREVTDYDVPRDLVLVRHDREVDGKMLIVMYKMDFKRRMNPNTLARYRARSRRMLIREIGNNEH